MLIRFESGFSVLGAVLCLTLRVGDSLLVNSNSDKVHCPTSLVNFLLLVIPMLFPFTLIILRVTPSHGRFCCYRLSGQCQPFFFFNITHWHIILMFVAAILHAVYTLLLLHLIPHMFHIPLYHSFKLQEPLGLWIYHIILLVFKMVRMNRNTHLHFDNPERSYKFS